MTKKEFTLLAHIIAKARFLGVTNQVYFAGFLADELKEVFPRFKRDLFIHEVKMQLPSVELSKYERRKIR